MSLARIGRESFYGLGYMVLFLAIGTALNFILAQAPFRRRDAENLGTIILIALGAAILHPLQLLLPETDHFWPHLLGFVLAFLEIALTALVLVSITATVQQRPAWAREGMTEFILIWLGSILIISVVMALHRPMYLACGMILILMSSLILVGSILTVYREQHYERQQREKPDRLAYQTDRAVLKKPGRFFNRIITQLMFSTAGIMLGSILIHLD